MQRQSKRIRKKTDRWVDDELSGIELGGNKNLLKIIRNKKISKDDNNSSNENYYEYKIKEYMRKLPNLEEKKDMKKYNIIDIDNIIDINNNIDYEPIMIGIPDTQIVEPIIIGNLYHEYTVLTIDDYNHMLDTISDELPFMNMD